MEGHIDAYIGKEVFSAIQNEGVYFPKLIPHTFRILTPQLRMLIWISPGGFEGYFRDMREPADSLGLPEYAVNYGEVGPLQRRSPEAGDHRDFGIRYVEGFTPPNFADLVANAPFSE